VVFTITGESCTDIRSGSCGLSRRLPGLDPLPGWPARTFRISPRRSMNRSSGPLRLRLLSRALERTLPTRAGLLSWDSRGLAPAVPLHRHGRMRPLPVGPFPVLPSARRRQSSSPVPPAWFRTTSAAFSASGSQAYCSPLPALGFIVFHCALRRLRPRPAHAHARGGPSRPIPTMHHPSEDAPLPQPYGVTAAPAPLPFAVPSSGGQIAPTSFSPPTCRRAEARKPADARRPPPPK